MGRIKKKWLLIKLILYFGVALGIAELCYLQVDQYLNQCMAKCYYPVATKVVNANGIQIPFFLDHSAFGVSSDLVAPARLQKLENLTRIVPIAFFGTAILVAAILFYYLNMRKPLRQLKMGMDKIVAQDLEFEITYHGRDELGKLCEVFETMRKNLKATFYDYWKSEEQQANLYSSIAHDLRTPLTILKGNNEVLRFLVENDPDSTEMIKTIELSDDAIKRMERYTDALKQMKALENWDKVIEEVDLAEFAEKLQAEGIQLAERQGKKLRVECFVSGKCLLDRTLIQLVIDRLLENALRFAKEEVIVRILCRDCDEKELLRIEVLDDGEGFSEVALKRATTLFFTTDSARKHSGIGLAAANSLLKCYGSCVGVENRKDVGGGRGWFEIEVELGNFRMKVTKGSGMEYCVYN